MHIRAICGSFRRRVWHPCHTHATLWSPPTEFTEFTEASGRGFSPTEFTEFTEVSGRGFSPTDFTEFTEVSGVGYSPTDFTEFTDAYGRGFSPTDFTDFHRWLGCVIGSVGMAGMPYPPNLCASVPICGRHFSARRFCVFRVFCGTLSPRLLVWERGSILPRISRNPQNVRLRYWRRGYGRDAIPS